MHLRVIKQHNNHDIYQGIGFILGTSPTFSLWLDFFFSIERTYPISSDPIKYKNKIINQSLFR